LFQNKYIKNFGIIIKIKKNIMAKAKGSSTASKKVSFGKKGKGKARKSYGPKDQKPKRYRGQGRA
jgi:hypothetical protein